MIQKMLDAFNKIHPLSEALIDALISITEINDYPKKTVLLKEGQKATRAYFVLKGMARAFYVSGEKETTRLFMDEGYVITSWLSFYTGEPAHECIEFVKFSPAPTS
jgi:signal-transduction protein with cAMP-binding, CBS, and nucleotidyltransferase domain